jgi:ADP-heptose:LPS heptosyltransferase
MNSDGILSIKRKRGLGNLFLLAPVLIEAAKTRSVELVTRTEWIAIASTLFPTIRFVAEPRPCTIDLDALTERDIAPNEHRTEHFSRLLEIRPTPPPVFLQPSQLNPPPGCRTGYLLVAPDASHPARTWPDARVSELLSLLAARDVVVAGHRSFAITDKVIDLRNKLTPEEFISYVAHADLVVTVDSSALHIAQAFRIPTVALFGGTDHKTRCSSSYLGRMIYGLVDCYPCNKRETCHGTFDCIGRITGATVLREIDKLLSTIV